MKKKCWLTVLLIGLTINAGATEKKITITFTPEMPLNPVNAEFICSSMYSHLSSAAIQHLSVETSVPYSCGLSSDGNHITMVFHVSS